MLAQMFETLAYLVGSVLAVSIIISAATKIASPYLERYARVNLKMLAAGSALGFLTYYTIGVLSHASITHTSLFFTSVGVGVGVERAYWLARNSGHEGTPPVPPTPYDW